jgi:hypothetical protein
MFGLKQMVIAANLVCATSGDPANRAVPPPTPAARAAVPSETRYVAIPATSNRAAIPSETRYFARPVLRPIPLPKSDPGSWKDELRYSYRDLYNGGMTEDQIKAMQ